MLNITPGELKGLKAVSDAKGVIRAAAMDQRGSLKKAIAKEGAAAFEAWLNAQGVRNIQALNAVLEKTAHPWFEKYGGQDQVQVVDAAGRPVESVGV